MFLVNRITSEPKQKQTLVFPDGTNMTLTMEYRSQQQGWFITSLIYGAFEIHGIRLCTSPNLLRQYKNQIPFGVACQVAGSFEPSLLDDFSQGRASLYILTTAEVAQYEAYLSG